MVVSAVAEGSDGPKRLDPGHVFYAERVQLSLHEQRVLARIEQQTRHHDPDFAALFTSPAVPPAQQEPRPRRGWRFWRRRS